MPKYIVLHGSLKTGKTEEGHGLFAKAGDAVELSADWVKKNDPRGIQFVTVEEFEKLAKAAEANAALEAKHAKERGELTEKQKAEAKASQAIHQKHLAAVAAVKAQPQAQPAKAVAK